MTAEIVADEQDRGRKLLAQLDDQIEHVGLDRRIESGRRFIQHQKCRIAGQRHGDGDALLHAARQVGADSDCITRSGSLMRTFCQHLDRARPAHSARGTPASSNTSSTWRPMRIDGLSARPDPDRPWLRTCAAIREVVLPSSAIRSWPSIKMRPSLTRAIARQIAQDGVGGGRFAAAGFADQAIGLAAPDLEIDAL